MMGVWLFVAEVTTKAAPDPSQATDWRFWLLGIGSLLGITWRKWMPEVIQRWVDSGKRQEAQLDAANKKVDALQDELKTSLHERIEKLEGDVKYWQTMCLRLIRGEPLEKVKADLRGHAEKAKEQSQGTSTRTSLHGVSLDEISEDI